MLCFSLCENESPEPSCVSMKSDASMIQPLTFSSGESSADLRCCLVFD